MQLQRLKELLRYNPSTGELSNCKNNRKRYPCPDGFITLYCGVSKKKYKIKASTACWELGNDKSLPKNSRVLHRNLDSTDNRLVNLLAVTRNTHRKLLEARRNLSGHLRLVPHPDDQYALLVLYLRDGIERREVAHDLMFARKRLLVLQLKFAKLLSKYCLFD